MEGFFTKLGSLDTRSFKQPVGYYAILKVSGDMVEKTIMSEDELS